MIQAYDGIMFDLDGTLADTLADIAAACNQAIVLLGREEIELPRFRYLAGQGLRYLIEHALEEQASEDEISQGMASFRTYYADHYTDQTKPYPGIPQLLDALMPMPIKVEILSNKPDSATQAFVTQVLEQWSFDAVRGALPNVPLKPDPTSALELTSQLSIPPSRWIYVGDTRVDMETAKAAGFFAVGVLWGFRDEPELREAGADVIISQPDQLLALIGEK